MANNDVMSKKEILFRRLAVASYWLAILLLVVAVFSFMMFISNGVSFVFVFMAIVLLSLTMATGGTLQLKIDAIDNERSEQIKQELAEKERQRDENKRVYGQENVYHYDWPLVNEGWAVPDEERAAKLRRNEKALRELEIEREELRDDV
jgi:uncharacterized protein (DUF58 family)